MIFLSQKKFVWENEVILGLRVLRKWFAIQLNGSFAFTKASSVVDSAATEEFEYTAVRNVKVGSACFSLEENLKLYFNGKYSVPVIFWNTRMFREHKLVRRKANVISKARKPMSEIPCVPFLLGRIYWGGGGGLGEFARIFQILKNETKKRGLGLRMLEIPILKTSMLKILRWTMPPELPKGDYLGRSVSRTPLSALSALQL